MSVYGHRAYRKRRAALIAQARKDGQECALCLGSKGPLDWDAPAGSPLAPTADHVDPLANGGKLLGELVIAHHSCNASKGKRTAPKIVRRPTKTSRNWLA